MITDTLTNFNRYLAIHPLFEEVAKLLKQNILATTPLGKTELIADKLYIIHEFADARSLVDAKLESHRRFIDIQIPLVFGESMGWKTLDECEGLIGKFDEQKDYGFYEDGFESVFAVPAGNFAIFFPDDAHAPLLGEGEFEKVIFKIACQ